MLEVSQLDVEYEKDQMTIKLSNSKHLALNHFNRNLQLDCPQLISFKTKTNTKTPTLRCYWYEYQVVQFLHPLSVTHL